MVDFVKLGDVCNILGGYAFKSDKFQDSGIPIIRIGNIVDEKINVDDVVYYPLNEYKNYLDFQIKKNDILLALSGATVGKIGIFDLNISALLNQRVARIRTNNVTLSKYIAYLLSSPYFRRFIDTHSFGCAQPNIGTKQVAEMEIQKNSPEKQQHIVKVLDTISSIIEKRKQQIALLEEAEKSLFVEMFGDPVANPMEWNKLLLKDLATKITNGATPKGGKEVYVNKGITFFRSQNVWWNRFDMTDIAYLDEKTHQNMKDSALKYGDILITKTGRFNTENSSLGRSALYLGKDGAANINGHVYLVRLSQEKVLNRFVLQILISDAFRKLIRTVCVGGIDKRQLNKNHIEEFPIILPPLDLQEIFVSRIKNIENNIHALKIGLKRINEVKSALMQQYFG